MATRELCGVETPNGPCTLRKGHNTGYHRHRIYAQVAWIIELAPEGTLLERGTGRIPLNYAVTRQLEHHRSIVIKIQNYRDSREIETGEIENET